MTALNLINIASQSIMYITEFICFALIGKHFFKATINKNKLISIIFIVVSIVTSYINEFHIERLPYYNFMYPAEKLNPSLVVVTFYKLFFFTTLILFQKNIPKIRYIIFIHTIFTIPITPIYQLMIGTSYHTRTITCSCIYVIIAVSIYFLSKKDKYNTISHVVLSLPIWLMIIIYSTSGCFSYLLYEIKLDILENLKAYIITTIICTLICLTYLIYKFIKIFSDQNKILIHMQDQKEYSEKMITNDDDLRRFRHDYRNHMIVINSLFESGQTDRAREYINNMNNSVTSSLTKISTGNFISDALINNKAVTAAEHNISIKFTGQVISSGIADEDLCTILSNTLDNAIEATRKLPGNKTIIIDAAIRNGLFIMNISNPVELDVKIRKDGTVKTSKKDSRNHGYGMKNVQRAVHKYNGNISAICENNIFSVEIMLKPTI